MLRKYLVTYFTDSISKQLQLVPPDSTSKSTLLTKLLTAKGDMAGAELAACSMEPQTRESVSLDKASSNLNPSPQSTINQSRGWLCK